MMLASVQLNVALVGFLRQLILAYFASDNYCTVIYYDKNLLDHQHVCDQYCEFLLAIEEALMQIEVPHTLLWIASLESTEDVLENSVNHGCQSYIVATKNIEMFLEMKLSVKENSVQRSRDKNFLLYFDGDHHSHLNGEEWIIEEAMKFYPNLWFVKSSGNDVLDFYSHDYSIAGTTKIQLVQSYNITVDKVVMGESSLFYDKLFDMGGREIAMAVTDYVPYCMTTDVGAQNGNVDAFNSSLPQELQLDGLEGSLILEFCRTRNCKVLLWSFGPNAWGDIFTNGTGYGEIYSTYSKQTELSICCMYYNWFLDYLDGSQYVAKSTVTTLVPGAKLLPTSLTVMYPFSNTVWLSVFIMLILMTGVHHLITTLNLKHLDVDAIQPPFSKSIFDMISIYLDQGIFPNTISSSYRLLISFILLSGVVLSNSYSSGLASVLTIPRYEKSIETVHEFAQSSFQWGAPALAWVLSLIGVEAHDIEKVVDKFDLIPDEDQLYRRSLKGDFGLAIELLNGGSYAFGSFIREDNVRSFDILKEEFYFTYTNAYAQRGWPLMEYFNSFILEANQFGFVIHWERRTVRKYLSHRVQEALEEIAAGHNEDGEFGPLSVQHIVGPMIVLGIGLVASLGIFVCELFVSLVYRFHDKHDEDKVKRNVSRVHRARRRY